MGLAFLFALVGSFPCGRVFASFSFRRRSVGQPAAGNALKGLGLTGGALASPCVSMRLPCPCVYHVHAFTMSMRLPPTISMRRYCHASTMHHFHSSAISMRHSYHFHAPTISMCLPFPRFCHLHASHLAFPCVYHVHAPAMIMHLPFRCACHFHASVEPKWLEPSGLLCISNMRRLDFNVLLLVAVTFASCRQPVIPMVSWGRVFACTVAMVAARVCCNPCHWCVRSFVANPGVAVVPRLLGRSWTRSACREPFASFRPLGQAFDMLPVLSPTHGVFDTVGQDVHGNPSVRRLFCSLEVRFSLRSQSCGRMY
jgi:hypothetical protein